MNPTSHSRPEEAEQAFYRAFQQADLAAMAALWADSQEVACIHPMARIVVGHEAVLASWQEIFAAGARFQLTWEPQLFTVQHDTAVSVLYEHFRLVDQDKVSPPFLATNIYRRVDGGWRMVLHHASPAVVVSTKDPSATPRHVH